MRLITICLPMVGKLRGCDQLLRVVFGYICRLLADNRLISQSLTVICNLFHTSKEAILSLASFTVCFIPFGLEVAGGSCNSNDFGDTFMPKFHCNTIDFGYIRKH